MNLLPHHAKELIDGSGISQSVIHERGYYSESDPAKIKALGFSEKQAALVSLEHPALIIPLWGVDKKIVGYQMKPDRPRERDGKPVKYETPAGFQMRLDVHPAWHAHLKDKTPLYITEGVKKGDAAVTRLEGPTICLIGVSTWRGSNRAGGKTELADWEAINLDGREVYIVFDSDVMTKREVRAMLIRLAGFIKRRGGKPKPVVLSMQGATDKVGLDDYFVAGGKPEGLAHLVNMDLIEGKRELIVDSDFAELISSAVASLTEFNEPPRVFQMAGKLFEIGDNSLAPISAARMRLLLAESARWGRVGKEGFIPCHPPKDVAETVLSAPSYPEDFPPIRGFSRCPILGPDRTIMAVTGYDSDSGYYITRSTPPAFDGDPVEWINREILHDFRFVGPADVAGAFALMLSGVVRPGIAGNCPLHLVQSHTPGSGKGLLVDACLYPTVGDVPTQPWPGGARDSDAEWQKVLASWALESPPAINIDNVTGRIQSATFDAVLTSVNFKTRLTGFARIVGGLRPIWCMTGNNAQLSTDLARRSVFINIDPGVESPERRSDFRHRDLMAFIRANSGTYLGAILKMVDRWIEAGRPLYDAVNMGSFAEYVGVIGGILEANGVTGFLGNLDEYKESVNDEVVFWRSLVSHWARTYQTRMVSANEVLYLAMDGGEITEAMAAIVGNGNKSSQVTRLGHRLKRMEGRVYGGFVIVRDWCSDAKTWRFGLREAKLENVQNPRTPLNLTTGVTKVNPREIFEGSQVQDTGVTGVYGGFDDPTHMRAHMHTEPEGKPPVTPVTPDSDDDDGFSTEVFTF